MATASKRTVNTSITVGAKTNKMRDVLEAQTFVGASDDATVTVNQNQPTYNAEGPVENEYPFNITFNWSEEK